MKRKFTCFPVIWVGLLAIAPYIGAQTPAPQDPAPGAVSGGNGNGAAQQSAQSSDTDKLFFDDPNIESVAGPEGAIETTDDKAKLHQLASCDTGQKVNPADAQFLVDRVRDRFKGKADSPSFVALVHIADYSETTAPASDCWYTVGREKILPPDGEHAGSNAQRWTVQTGTAPRLYGTKDIGVLFYHLDDKTGSTIGAVMNNVAYKAVVKKKLPSNLQNLLSLIKVSTLHDNAAPFSYWGHGMIHSISVPSDVTVMGVGLQGKAKRIGDPIKADNEGKHYWDASVLVPVTKLSGLSYSGTPAQFAPKQINVQTVYGAVDFYMSTLWGHPIDLKGGKERLWMPRFVAGIGLTGHPGDRFLFGASLGTPQLQGFAGVAYGRVDQLNPNAVAGGSAAVVRQFYHSNLAFGINIPVAQAIQSLTAKK